MSEEVSTGLDQHDHESSTNKPPEVSTGLDQHDHEERLAYGHPGGGPLRTTYMPRKLDRVYYPAAGVLATLAGVAAGHVAAALLTPASSPVLAVGSAVIDLTPTPLKEYAVREFGTKDKPLLIGSVFIATLMLAAVAGHLAKKRFALGAGVIVLLVAVAGIAALTRPAATVVDVVPALVGALVAVGALAWLVRARQATPKPEASEIADTSQTTATNRRTLFALGGVAALAVAAGGAGTWIGKARTRIGNITFAQPADPAPAFPEGLEVKYAGISPLRTPTEKFYKVDTKLAVPIVDVETWKLSVGGDVSSPFSLTFDELAAMPLVERDITLTCVSNEVGGSYVGSARWLGVPRDGSAGSSEGRQQGRPIAVGGCRRVQDQHAAGRRHGRTRRHGRDRHERRAPDS